MIYGIVLVALFGANLENRIQNDSTTGVCWWCCADSVLGTDMTVKVMQTGIGRDHGAHQVEITYWCYKYDVKQTATKNIGFVEQLVRADELVIVTVRPWLNATHAIVPLEIMNVRVNGRIVKGISYFDPNFASETKYMSWSDFKRLFCEAHILERKNVR